MHSHRCRGLIHAADADLVCIGQPEEGEIGPRENRDADTASAALHTDRRPGVVHDGQLLARLRGESYESRPVRCRRCGGGIRGLTSKQILRYYILPNLYPPVITLLGLSLPGIIGGSVILETIFSIDGMGLLFYQSALSHDYPVIMGILIIGAFLTLIGNMIADLVLLKLNPNYEEK